MSSIKDKGHKNKEKDQQANLQVVTILVTMELATWSVKKSPYWKTKIVGCQMATEQKRKLEGLASKKGLDCHTTNSPYQYHCRAVL